MATLKYSSKTKHIVYGPVNKLHGHDNVRWIENANYGLRSCGFADDIVRLRHRGWFTEDDGANDEVYRGIVYQLPARDGKEQYVYGYVDPNNEGCALICFDVQHDKEDAARAADNFAERMAEDARDFNRTWQAGQRYRELGEEVKDLRSEALTIGREMRAVKAATDARLRAPTLCATLRKEIMALYRRIQKARKERAELLENFGRREGFTE